MMDGFRDLVKEYGDSARLVECSSGNFFLALSVPDSIADYSNKLYSVVKKFIPENADIGVSGEKLSRFDIDYLVDEDFVKTIEPLVTIMKFDWEKVQQVGKYNAGLLEKMIVSGYKFKEAGSAYFNRDLELSRLAHFYKIVGKFEGLDGDVGRAFLENVLGVDMNPYNFGFKVKDARESGQKVYDFDESIAEASKIYDLLHDSHVKAGLEGWVFSEVMSGNYADEGILYWSFCSDYTGLVKRVTGHPDIKEWLSHPVFNKVVVGSTLSSERSLFEVNGISSLSLVSYLISIHPDLKVDRVKRVLTNYDEIIDDFLESRDKLNKSSGLFGNPLLYASLAFIDPSDFISILDYEQEGSGIFKVVKVREVKDFFGILIVKRSELDDFSSVC